MVLCRFFRDFIGWSELSTLVRATCGLDLDTPALQKLANRITQETRRYNWREGIPESADRLPARFLRESTAEGATLNEADLLRMVSDYNSIRAERERS
jgi:aldehyde:ferredoxin oxidoreductase